MTSMEEYITGTGQIVSVHNLKDCAIPDRCVIHNPSNHSMSFYPTHWRSDRNLMERICPHNAGHPDPDSLHFLLVSLGDELFKKLGYGIHGCDGCCAPLSDEKLCEELID